MSDLVEEFGNNPSHGGSRRLLCDAALTFGVELTTQEFDDWRSLLAGAALVDHLLDPLNVGGDVALHISQIFDGENLDGMRDDLQDIVRNYIEIQPQDVREGILEGVRQAGELALRQRETWDPSDVVSLRLEEAKILSNLLSLPCTGKEDAPQREIFNNWLIGWSRAGYLLDSLLDLGADFWNGESRVEPTFFAKVILAYATAKESFKALRKTPPRLLGKCAMNGINYAIRDKKLSATA